MSTKPQDIVISLKLCLESAPKTYAALSVSLGMSASEVHAAFKRLSAARLFDLNTKEIRRSLFFNYLVHGVPYSFPVQMGGVTRGVPTAWAAPVFATHIKSDQIPPVWPHTEGQIQGSGVQPLYASVPGAAERDPALYDLLALVDALRIGRARERAIAEKEIIARIYP